MYIPICVIAVALFLINPDLAFLFGIIYCFAMNPILLIPVVAIFLLIKGVDYYNYEVAPAIKRNKYKLFRYAIKHRKVYYIVKYNKLILWSLMFISAVIIYIYGMIGALI